MTFCVVLINSRILCALLFTLGALEYPRSDTQCNMSTKVHNIVFTTGNNIHWYTTPSTPHSRVTSCSVFCSPGELITKICRAQLAIILGYVVLILYLQLYEQNYVIYKWKYATVLISKYVPVHRNLFLFKIPQYLFSWHATYNWKFFLHRMPFAVSCRHRWSCPFLDFSQYLVHRLPYHPWTLLYCLHLSFLARSCYPPIATKHNFKFWPG